MNKLHRLSMAGLVFAMFWLVPLALAQWNIREIVKTHDIMIGAGDPTGIEHYQAETVRFTIKVKRDRKKVAVPSDSTPVWKAWAAADTSTLLINKSGSIVSAGGGVVKVELTKTESDLATGTYVSEVRLLSADLVDMGILYYTTNHVVNYSSSGGTLVPPNADTDLGGWSITNANFMTATGGFFDVDRNTGIKVEESADENIIRFDTAGTERFRVEADGALYLTPTDAEPTGAEGRVYWDNSENTVKAHNGTAWVAVGLAGATAHSGLTGLTTGDDHTHYRLESSDHTHASSGAQAGTIDHGSLTGAGDDDHDDYVDKTGDTLTGSLTLADDTWVGVGASAGRVEFDDTTIDVVEILGANVRVGAVTPDTATAASDLAVLGMIESQGSGGIMAYSASSNPSVILDREGSDTWDIRNVSGVFHIYNSSDAGSRLSIDAGDGDVTVANDLEVNLIREKTADTGVTIDSALIKDGEFKSAYVDLFHVYQGTQQTHTDNTGFHLVNWDTATTDGDSVFTDAADSITFNGTGLVHMTMHYEFNNILGNKHVMCRLMKDGVEFMGFWSFVNGNSGKNIGPTGSLIFYNDSAANVWTIEIYQNDSTSETSHSGTDGKRKWWSGYRMPN